MKTEPCSIIVRILVVTLYHEQDFLGEKIVILTQGAHLPFRKHVAFDNLHAGFPGPGHEIFH